MYQVWWKYLIPFKRYSYFSKSGHSNFECFGVPSRRRESRFLYWFGSYWAKNLELVLVKKKKKTSENLVNAAIKSETFVLFVLSQEFQWYIRHLILQQTVRSYERFHTFDQCTVAPLSWWCLYDLTVFRAKCWSLKILTIAIGTHFWFSTTKM